MVKIEEIVFPVSIYAEDGSLKNQGTGFFVTEELFVTARHIKKNYTEEDKIVIDIIDSDLVHSAPTEIVYEDQASDILILKALDYRSEKFRGIVSEVNLNEEARCSLFGYSEGYTSLGHWFGFNRLRNIENNRIIKGDIELYLEIPAINLEGASGAPIIHNDMIVAMANKQTAKPTVRSVIAIRAGLIQAANKFGFSESSQIIDNFENYFSQMTKKFIDQNIKSKKYIPQIFIETGTLKEELRCMSHPSLFINKIVDEYNRISVSSLNAELASGGLPKFQKKALGQIDTMNPESFFNESKKIESEAKKFLNELESSRERFGIETDDFDFKKALVGYGYGQELEVFYLMKKFSSLNSQITLILGDAGQGKTNLLCDLAASFLSAYDLPTIVFDASNIKDSNIDESFISMIDNDLGSVMSVIDDLWTFRKKTVVILIDGINELSDTEKFEESLYALRHRFDSRPYVKIIMTARNELFEERFKRINKDDSIRKIQIYERHQNDKKIMNRLFQGYMDFFNIEASNIGSDVKKQISADKLLLRIFSEAYGDENTDVKRLLPPLRHLNLANLFNLYLAKQEKNICKTTLDTIMFDKILDELVEFMLNSMIFNDISLTELVGIDQIFLNKIINESILYKLNHDSTIGLRSKKIISISFTYDEMRDFLISSYLVDQFKNNVSIAKSRIEKLTNESFPPTEGVRKYLFFASKENSDLNFQKFIELSSWYPVVLMQNIELIAADSITTNDLSVIRETMFSFQGPYKSVFCLMVRARDKESDALFSIKYLFRLILENSDQSNKFFYKLLEYDFLEKYGQTLPGELIKFGYELIDDGNIADDSNILIIPLFHLLRPFRSEFKRIDASIQRLYPIEYKWGLEFLEGLNTES